ncbi:hypothetical protein IFM12275_06460 [Nocardia sputorum]|nr:hypothetical protein IFM12275_06460 [Nocardia sputorum]
MAPNPDAGSNPFLSLIGESGQFGLPAGLSFVDLNGDWQSFRLPWDLDGDGKPEDEEDEKDGKDTDKDDKDKDGKKDDPTASPGGGSDKGGSGNSAPKGGGAGPSGGPPGNNRPSSGNPNTGGKPNSGSNSNGGGNPYSGGPADYNPGGGPIKVDPQDLINKGKRLADLPSSPKGLFDVLGTLSDSLQRLGNPWGADEFGKQFADGATGYSASAEALVGNASRGPDATGAIPIFGQLLVNYGTTIEQAGRAFAAGEDLYAQWILKNYVDENASGDPGPYKGPLSSDPNFGKNTGSNNPSGPPPGDQDQQSGNGGGQNSGGSTGGGSNSGGSDPAGSSTGDPDANRPNMPSTPHLATTSTPDPAAPLSVKASSSNPIDALATPGPTLGGIPAHPGVPAFPGALGPNAYRATDPGTGVPVDKTGSPATGGKGGGIPSAPLPRMLGAAYDGEKLVPKAGGIGAAQSRAGVLPQAAMPGMPGTPAMGSSSGQSVSGKEKRQERREPPVEEQFEPEPDAADPWHGPGLRDGGR